MKKLFALVIVLLGTYLSYGQESITKPSIFLDCQIDCFTTFLRQEHGYVDYKRERQGADVFILVTEQNASAGAEEIQMIFDYEDIKISDCLLYTSPSPRDRQKSRMPSSA